MNLYDKIATALSIVVGLLLTLLFTFACVWLISIFWFQFPLPVKIFVGIIALIPSYCIAIGLVLGTSFLLSKIDTRRVYYPQEDGMYIAEGFRGKLKPLPSLRGASPLKQLGTTKVEEIVPEVPRLSQLLQDDMLVNDREEVLLGFKTNGTPRYGQWPSVFAMAGIGNSGKSVSMVLFIIIAILLGYEVVVCDPHKTKERSLYKKLQPLEAYITFAFTSDEILAESLKFSEELAEKKQGYNTDTRKLLVYDELTSIVKRNADISKQIVRVVEEASQEGMGYYHNVMLACHTVTEDGLGDVAIRNALNGIFCHRLDSDQSKYVLKDKRYYRKSGSLPSGHVFYRDELHEIEYLIMPYSERTDTISAMRMIQDKGVIPQVKMVSGTLTTNHPSRQLSMPSIPLTPMGYQQRLTGNKQQTNTFTPDKHPVNTPLEGLEEKEYTVYPVTDKSKAITPQSGVNTSSVNSVVNTDESVEKHKITLIIRMRKRGIAHRDIAYSIGMYGKKWVEYQMLCEKYNISITEVKEVQEEA